MMGVMSQDHALESMSEEVVSGLVRFPERRSGFLLVQADDLRQDPEVAVEVFIPG
jgi:hypothetical protein